MVPHQGILPGFDSIVCRTKDGSLKILRYQECGGHMYNILVYTVQFMRLKICCTVGLTTELRTISVEEGNWEYCTYSCIHATVQYLQ
jgi:hypothetical protein